MAGRTIIRSLRMERFGCFQDKTVEFAGGLNQIVGANESGKSTIVRALFTALFEDGTTQKKAIAALRTWNAGNPFRLTLDFTVGNKRFTLVRDHGTGKDIMTDSDGISYEGKAINEKLAVYFGTVDRVLFESVFCFSSDTPDAPESSKGRLQSAMETPVFSGFDRGQADRYLEEEIKKLDNPRAHGPRELDIIGEQISNCLQEKTELDERLEALQKDGRELVDIRHKVTEYEERVTHLESEIEGAEAYYNLSCKMANLEERLQLHLGNYSRAAQVTEDLARVEKELGIIRVPGTQEMAGIVEKGEALGSTMQTSKNVMDDLITRRKKADRAFLTATLVLMLLCLAYVLEQSGYIRADAVADIIPYTIPVMGIIWLIRMGVYLTQFFKKKKATMVFRQALSALDKFYAELNIAYGLKAADPVKALGEAIQRKEGLEISAENLRNTIAVLSENKGLEALNEVKKQLETEVAQFNQEMAPLAKFSAAAGQLANLKEELIAKRVRGNAMRERAVLLTERCSVMQTIIEKIGTVDNQMVILKRKHKEITEKLEILRITRMALNRAADQLIEDTFAEYGDEASSHLTALTGGRYDQVRFTREKGRFELKLGNTDRWLEVSEALSSSTRDCIYLALRLAAFSRVSAEFAPPIIFDQAEARMDDRRRRNFRSLIQRLAGDRQLLYIALEAVDLPVDSHVIQCDLNELACLPSEKA